MGATVVPSMVSLCITMYHHHKGLQPEAYLDYCDREKLDFRKHRLGTSAADGTLDYHRLFWHVLTVSFKTKWFYAILLLLLHSKFGSISILTPTSVCKRYVHNLTLRYRHMLNRGLTTKEAPTRWGAVMLKDLRTATAPLNRTPARQIAMTKIRRNDMIVCGFPHVPTRAFNWRSLEMRTHLWQLGPEDCPFGDGPQVYKARFIDWFIMFLWFMRCRMMPRKSAIIRYPCWSMWLRSRIVGVPCMRQLRDKLPCFFYSSNKHRSLASRLDQIRLHICQCNGAGDKSPRTVVRTSLLPKWASKTGKTCRKSCKNWKSGSAVNEEKQRDQPPCSRFLLLVALMISHHVVGAKWIQIVQQ